MAVRPSAIDLTARTVTVQHDEQEHGGDVPFSQIAFVRNPIDGSPDPRYLSLPCPVSGCGAVSLWPVSGGADPASGQRLLALLTLSALPARQRDWSALKPRFKALVIAMDGARAWRWEDDDPLTVQRPRQP